jgi:RecB family exonuclease
LARALDVPVPGFTHGERGELVHEALDFVWSQLQRSAALLALSADARTDLLQRAVERALGRVCARRDPGVRWRAREAERLLTLLRRWLDVEAARAPFVVEARERDAHLVLAGLHFNFRIDRQDLLDDGARLLIDYKTGMAHADWRGERPDNPQLPLYAMLRPEHLIGVAYARVNAQDPDFVPECERDAVFGSRRHTKLEGERDFAALLERWQQRLDAIAAQFAAGMAQVAPLPSACRHCRLQALCRIPMTLDDAVPADE